MIFINTETTQRQTMELLIIASIRCANEMNFLPLFMAVIPMLLEFCVDLIGAYASSISTTGAQLYYDQDFMLNNVILQKPFCVAREVWQASLMFYNFSIFLVWQKFLPIFSFFKYKVHSVQDMMPTIDRKQLVQIGSVKI